MKVLLFSVLIGFSFNLFADSEFGEFEHIGNESFRSRFYVKGELFVLDASGKKLLAPTTDIREWRAGMKAKKIEAFWKTKAKGIRDIALHLEWDIHDDNSLTVSLHQYESIEGEREGKKIQYGKLIREQKFELENFAPVSWVAETGGDFRVVLRMTPELESYREYQNLEKITIGGDRGTFMVTDNQGYLWGENVRFGGIISGMSCHRGAFIMSFYPFKGSQELGFAMGKKIELHLTDSLKVQIRNEEELVPGEGRVKVYGVYIPKFKMKSLNSVFSFGQEKVEQIPKEFGL